MDSRLLRVFDFDDTLVHTSGKIRIHKRTGKTLVLTPHEYADHRHDPENETIDFGDFWKLVDPRPIKKTQKILENTYQKYGKDSVVILTARNCSVREDIRAYFQDSFGMDLEVVTLANPQTLNPAEDKAKWLKGRLDDLLKNVESLVVEIYEDSPKNLRALCETQQSYPESRVKVKGILVSTKENSAVGLAACGLLGAELLVVSTS